MQFARALRSRLFRVDPAEVTFARRGFPKRDPARVERLESVAAHFLKGYTAAIREPAWPALTRALEALPLELRGFAYEGAGMALELLDRLSPIGGDRLRRFLAGPGNPHSYMVHIGAGWAWARLPWRPRLEARLRALDPVLGWLTLDGYGFHQGYFRSEPSFEQGLRPKGLCPSMQQAFDTGLGRSLWFVVGADPEAAAKAIDGLAPDRADQLWAGCGLACAYAGGVPESEVRRLAELAGSHRAALAQGAAFAAKARQRAGNPAPHTALAVEVFCGVSAEAAAARCDTTLAELKPRASSTPLFHEWRTRLALEFAS